jgi:prevent-host-death family protein
MPDLTTDIQSISSFRRQSSQVLKRLGKTKRPMLLTVNGKAAAVVQDAAAYQRLLDIAAFADDDEAVRQGLDDIANGRTRPAEKVFDQIRRKYGIPD